MSSICNQIRFFYSSIFRFANDIEFMTGSRPNIFWMICWKYISPLAIFVIFIANIVKQASGTYSYNAYVGCILVRVFSLFCEDLNIKCRPSSFVKISGNKNRVTNSPIRTTTTKNHFRQWLFVSYIFTSRVEPSYGSA